MNGDIDYQWPTSHGCYPAEVFPPIIRDAVFEVTENLNLPVELAAHAALGAISLAVQRFANIKCPGHEPAPCSLFLIAISNSSGGKSLAEQRFIREFVAFERRQSEEVAVKEPQFRAEQKIWQEDDRRLSKEYGRVEKGSAEEQLICQARLQHELDRPVKPEQRQLRYAELSPQGLRDVLIEHGAIGIFSPEAGPVLTGITFSQQAMLSSYWSGEDRPTALVSGDRRPVEPRLTIVLQVQEGKFSNYMKRRGSEAFEVGLMSRFLVAAPYADDKPGQRVYVEDMSELKLGLFNERVRQILEQTVPLPHDRQVRRLSDDAKLYWRYFKERVHDDLICGSYSDDMKSFFRKLAQQASRIATLLDYFEGRSGDVSGDSMESAIALCEWYAHEFIRIFSEYFPSQRQKIDEAKRDLLLWLQGVRAAPYRCQKLTPGRYTERELNNYSNIRGEPAVLGMAIDELGDEGHISVDRGRKGGRIIVFPPLGEPLTHQFLRPIKNF
ncbi:DUF3987 domain-containing protein [Burkholderia sp. AU30198]|uniref:DUF3987 domain-containing protein n=1 Tax=Burkholderia sp. AU30198 TaxID=2879627 RepID=UPI001CF52997|nr:DUF3987 domain-containing protein [Burkholderia sp. AU30198]MCA8296891.1 DUF3987 domain-containing protein [Burkholderia sp. AU30198]